MAEFRVMGIAAAYGRIGYVVLADDQLIDWGVSKAASRSPEKALAKATEWIELLSPQVIVTERVGSNPRKRGKTLALMTAVHRAAQQSTATSVTTTKIRRHQNKYQEARALARLFPELTSRLATKPKCWLAEPRRMILFEALALALRLKETR